MDLGPILTHLYVQGLYITYSLTFYLIYLSKGPNFLSEKGPGTVLFESHLFYYNEDPKIPSEQGLETTHQGWVWFCSGSDQSLLDWQGHGKYLCATLRSYLHSVPIPLNYAHRGKPLVLTLLACNRLIWYSSEMGAQLKGVSRTSCFSKQRNKWAL